MTASTTSSPILRSAPGRGASTSPSSRSAPKRLRHFDTVTGLQPNTAAICACVRSPSAQASTILQRSASACDELWRRAQRSSVARSSPDSLISTVGRPRRAMILLRCWLTTPRNAARTRKFPISQNFLADQPAGTLEGFGPVLLDGIVGHVGDAFHHLKADLPLMYQPEQILGRDPETTCSFRCPEEFSGHVHLQGVGRNRVYG